MLEGTSSGGSSLAADVIIIGGGVAGLSLALNLPASVHIVLLTKDQLGESNTRYAQGGLAAAIGTMDSEESHVRDTLLAGADHCDEAAVRTLVHGSHGAVRQLLQAGTQFDPAYQLDAEHAVSIADHTLALGREAAHSHNRILHASGDATGAEIERALVASVRARSNIMVIENAFVSDILLRYEVVCGVQVILANGQTQHITGRAVVLANGGAGQLWQRTSNPAGATADGFALAWRAGAVLTDLEFVQFHPTVLIPSDPAQSVFLISEAVRGEGAYLRNQAGERFMLGYEGAELAPRDVVARAIAREMLRFGTTHVWLDLRHLDSAAMHQRFPTIASMCARQGLDIATDLLPVAPAAHYFMGGVAVDLEARTTVSGLWAIGEVACTGVHGANRLASNSLLEGIVFAGTAARSIERHLGGETGMWPAVPRFEGTWYSTTPLVGKHAIDPALRPALQEIMWRGAGLFRESRGLHGAAAELERLAALSTTAMPVQTTSDVVHAMETANMLLASQLIVQAALLRNESRGAHARIDYPQANPELAGHRAFFARAGRPQISLSDAIELGMTEMTGGQL